MTAHQFIKLQDVVWRLDDLYPGSQDPSLEADRQWCLNFAKEFAANYAGRVSSLGASELLQAIRDYEALQERLQRLMAYAYLNFTTQTQEPEASALLQSTQEFHSTLHRDTLFFELEWIRLHDSQALTLAAAPELSHYRHYLESLRRYKAHILSEAEERLLAEREPTGASAWATLFDKILTRLQFGPNKRTESEVLKDLYHQDRSVRKTAAEELTEGLGEMQHVLVHLTNTLLLDKAIDDRQRNYPHWLRSRNLANEADDEMVESLIQSVISKYGIVHRYYTLKKEMLGLEELYDYDRYAPLPGLPQKRFAWEEAQQIILAAFGAFTPRMAEIAGEFFSKGWIHAPIVPGKRSGAFSHPTVPSSHPYVLLNFSGSHRDVMTLAHELGHGIHQFLARGQGLFNANTPLTTAETASVFGEMLVFQHILRQTSAPGERLALLCAKLEDIFATVFRQVAMNRFEDGAHRARRSSGELSGDHISEIWMQTQKAMFGDSVQLRDSYRIWWSYIPHFVHSPGYVYAYAFGELLVLALYDLYQQEGSAFTSKYLTLLASGGKDSPQALLTPFGIDLRRPEFWDRGLNVLEKLLQSAEDLWITVRRESS